MSEPAEHTSVPIRYEKRDALAFVELHRPEKRNAFNREMFRLLGDAMREADDDADVRCVVIHAAGPDFTTGLDLVDIAPAWMRGELPFDDDDVDPWGVLARRRGKPLVTAVHGRCYTLGFELALASDCCIAAEDTVFALREVQIGIYPAGGGTWRLVASAGWSNAMRWVLTGDEMDAREAYRLALVQEVVPPQDRLERAVGIAERIAANAPLAVQAALASARRSVEEGWPAAIAALVPDIRRLIATRDAAEALAARAERRTPRFKGR